MLSFPAFQTIVVVQSVVGDVAWQLLKQRQGLNQLNLSPTHLSSQELYA